MRTVRRYKVTEFLLSACNDGMATSEAGPPVASAEDIRQEGPFRFQKTEFFCPELEHINKCAYSDYQREKVYVRTSPAIRKSLRRKQRLRKRTLRVNEHIECSKPDRCPECGGTQININQRPLGHRTVFDLRFSSSGVRSWVTQYSSLGTGARTAGTHFCPISTYPSEPESATTSPVGYSTTTSRCVRHTMTSN